MSDAPADKPDLRNIMVFIEHIRTSSALPKLDNEIAQVRQNKEYGCFCMGRGGTIMTELVRFTVRERGAVVFETQDKADEIRQTGLGRVGKVIDAHQAFESKLSDIRDAASAALSILKEDLHPDAVTLRFGISMTVEAGAVIARTAVGGNMEVEMSWRRGEPAAAVTPKSTG
jgi:hypothetical protein